MKDKALLIAEIRTLIRASIGNRAKESLVVILLMKQTITLWRTKLIL